MTNNKTDLPERINIMPLRGCPVFPGVFNTIEVSDYTDKLAVMSTSPEDGLGLLLLKPEAETSKKLKAEDFYTIGTFAKVKSQITNLYGSLTIYVEALCRFRVKELLVSGTILKASVEYIEETELNPLEQQAYLTLLRNAIAKRDDHSFFTENLKFNTTNIPQAIRLADFLAGCIIDKEQQQEFLEDLDGKSRITKILKALEEDFAVQVFQNTLRKQVAFKADRRQVEYMLREEMKLIQTQLDQISSNPDMPGLSGSGPEPGNPEKTKKLIHRLMALNLTGEARETVFREYDRMSHMEQMNPEFSNIRTYLETVADLPWNTFSPEKIDISKAKAILEKDHYGIKDVKERIIEFLAVRKLKQDTKGSIICLVGPPGTGKTSVGVSIAKSLNRKYYRFSVGGMRDEAEIKGHRRTYLGAMPGQIIKGLKVTKTKNPVFVIDEIDKLTVSNQGDPAAALLEVLDPEQNTSFRDHYLDIPFDVSNVLFLVTANSTDTIPRPLLDRMECIELNGYTSEEKLNIGKKYLVPKTRKKNGLKSTDIKFPDQTLSKIAEQYAREAGVRNYEKSLDKICRKVAVEIVSSQDCSEKVKTPVLINDSLLLKYLGQPIFPEDEILVADKVGMAIGLAWTSMGGDVLAVEARKIPGKGELKLTGQLGDVMKESANIAFSYVKSIACEKGFNPDFFEKNTIHLHVPEGATPKDGPSAGITMATALYGLVSDKVMAPSMAMTGELSLLGKVMPIGGLKEKVLAAKRNKIKTILIPKFNKRDLDKLEENVKEGIVFHLVSDMQEVISYAFPTPSGE